MHPPSSPSWRSILLLILAVTGLRLVYLIFLCPYELVADEAQYWDWSRRLDWCYYSKGPGIAWVIAASTRWLGDSMWAVRLPAVISSAITAWFMARLAGAVAGPNLAQRAAWFGALLVLLLPAYQATAILMTIDGPMLACWSAALWFTLRIVDAGDDAPSQHQGQLLPWVGLGLALGVGVLFKYTILLFLPGLILYILVHPRALPMNRRNVSGLLIALGILTLCFLPALIWNQQRGWPTLAHLLGNVDLPGGDVPVQPGKTQSLTRRLISPLEFLGSQIALVGPMLGIFVVAAAQTLRRSKSNPLSRGEKAGVRVPADDKEQTQADDPVFHVSSSNETALSHAPAPQPSSRGRGSLLLLYLSFPILLFYLMLSFLHSVEGNWPIAGYLGLIALAAAILPMELDRWRNMRAMWRNNPDRPRMGILQRQPETLAQIAWHWAIGYGLVAGIGMCLLFPLAQMPGMGTVVPVFRFLGAEALGEKTAWVLTQTEVQQTFAGREPILATARYGDTALLAFYTPGRPRVGSATSFLGGRKSSYDFFSDTDLRNPALIGRPMLIVTTDPPRWELSYDFRGVWWMWVRVRIRLPRWEQAFDLHQVREISVPADVGQEPRLAHKKDVLAVAGRFFIVEEFRGPRR